MCYKKIFKVAAMFASVTLAAFAHAGDGQSGNGGGGIRRNGIYQTFYSAGFYTEPNELAISEVPQLEELIHFFNSEIPLGVRTQAQFVSQLLPTTFRKYFKVESSAFTPEVRARLLEEYSRQMKADKSDLAIFAITDTKSRNTYLLPEFYALKPIEQQAILFHEAFWLRFPRTTYQQVIRAEIAFQSYLERPESGDRFYRFLETIEFRQGVLTAVVKRDLKTGALNGLVKGKRYISAKDLLGKEYYVCNFEGSADCLGLVVANIQNLLIKYPNSLFLKFLLNCILSGDFRINNIEGYGLKHKFWQGGGQVDLYSPDVTGELEFRIQGTGGKVSGYVNSLDAKIVLGRGR